MTKSARCTFSSVGSCASMRASAWAGGQAVALDDARHLLAARAARDDDAIEVAVAAGLVEQRDVDDGQASPAAARRSSQACRSPRARADGRSPRDRRGPARRANTMAPSAAAIEAPSGSEDAARRSARPPPPGRAAGRDGVAGQRVGVERRDAVRGEPRADVALARRDAAGQRHAQQRHRAALAFGALAVVRRGEALLDERVPLVAVRALPEQLVAAVAAAQADVRVAVEDGLAADRPCSGRRRRGRRRGRPASPRSPGAG